MIEKELVLFVIGLIAALFLMAGVTIGFWLYAKSNVRGNLVIAPGDADAANYLFLDLDVQPTVISRQKYVVLRVEDITRK